MYQVLLVDDEPIILSGIKFSVDWQKNDCIVIGTAANGMEALEKISTLHPDIVLCDIKMPVMDGLELLETASHKFPDIVFIMLTNLNEFSLVRHAIQLNAVDYLLKNQLETPAMEQALTRAKLARERYANIHHVDLVNHYQQQNQFQILKDSFSQLLSGQPLSNEQKQMIEQTTSSDGYGVMQILTDLTPVKEHEANVQTINEEHTRLFSWVTEITTKVAEKFFQPVLILSLDEATPSLFLFTWHHPEKWGQQAASFSAQLSRAVRTVTQVHVSSLCCSWVPSTHSECTFPFEQLKKLQTYYYLSATSFVYTPYLPNITLHSLDIAGFAKRLLSEVNAKNSFGCDKVFSRIEEMIKNTDHTKSDALRLCNELYYTAYNALFDSSADSVPEFWKNCNMVFAISQLHTRAHVLVWLAKLKERLLQVMESAANDKSALLERVQQYILGHPEERLTLSYLSDYAGISSAYLSTLFKNKFGENLMSFVNRTKVEYACQLIRENRYRIIEISSLLGFDSYYFTKVFKKFVGMTPTEYQSSLKNT